MERVFKLSEINLVAADFWQSVGYTVRRSQRTSLGAVFAFHGEMGSGKTTFIHALCEAKKVKDVVGSPSFSIINEYGYDENGLEKKIYHIDLYRLKDEAEAIHAGIEDCLYSDHICMAEWPEKAPGLFPEETVHVFISTLDPETRKIKLSNLKTY